MPSLRSDDAEIFYDVRGSGPAVVLLHPFPVNGRFWEGCLPALETRYRVIIPDLRGHGHSSAGEGAATMEKHAGDLSRLCRVENVTRAAFVGVSIGGYILLEFWRQSRDRVAALVLANTRAGADTEEARLGREKSALEIEQRGPTALVDSLLPKLLGKTTQQSHPDIVDRVGLMVGQTSAKGAAAAQRGMASRPGSFPTLQTISVPTLLVAGDEDELTPAAELEAMHKNVPGSRFQVLAKAGHYAALEQPEVFSSLLRNFLDGLQFVR